MDSYGEGKFILSNYKIIITSLFLTFFSHRGTLDDKESMFGILESAEYLLSQNFKPKRSIFFWFGHGKLFSAYS
jgi:hypothetical protein